VNWGKEFHTRYVQRFFCFICLIFAASTPYRPEQVQWCHNVGAAVGRSCPLYIPTFLSFIKQVFGLVSEFECWSLFMIAPFVWKELVLIACQYKGFVSVVNIIIGYNGHIHLLGRNSEVLLLLFHWHYGPLWALACRAISFHFFPSVTNSLHHLTPST
jgi:hypothetical protein